MHVHFFTLKQSTCLYYIVTDMVRAIKEERRAIYLFICLLSEL